MNPSVLVVWRRFQGDNGFLDSTNFGQRLSQPDPAVFVAWIDANSILKVRDRSCVIAFHDERLSHQAVRPRIVRSPRKSFFQGRNGVIKFISLALESPKFNKRNRVASTRCHRAPVFLLGVRISSLQFQPFCSYF